MWYVAIGSALGGASRYLLGTFLQRSFGTTFPIGTLAINVLGSLVLGFLLRLADQSTLVTPEARLFLGAGLCGGFTTFSTFSYETAALFEAGEWRRVAWYVGLSVILSLAATFAGFALAREALAGARHG